jgi:hypothetical protein
VTVLARERLPQPLVMDGIVRNDVGTRTLVVSRPENLSGYQKVAWRTAHEALVKAEQNGWYTATGRPSLVPYLFAHGAGQTDIAHGLPGDKLTLLFHFPAGVEVYTKLVSQPGLRALVTVDKSSGWFTRVKFIHGRKG